MKNTVPDEDNDKTEITITSTPITGDSYPLSYPLSPEITSLKIGDVLDVSTGIAIKIPREE